MARPRRLGRPLHDTRRHRIAMVVHDHATEPRARDRVERWAVGEDGSERLAVAAPVEALRKARVRGLEEVRGWSSSGNRSVVRVR